MCVWQCFFVPIRHCDKNCQYGSHNFHGILLQNIENTLRLFGGACLNIMLYSSLKTSGVTLITVCQSNTLSPKRSSFKGGPFLKGEKAKSKGIV